MLTRRLVVLGALLAVTGCGIDKQGAPALSGPSELGLSLTLTATPDVISQDGLSQATIEILARDAASQPVRGLTLRAEIRVGSTAVDFGALSSRTVSTGNDGKASLFYRAPSEPPPSVGEDAVVTIAVTPVGSNYGESVSRVVQIRLARPGVILPPNGTPKADFFFSPTLPKEDDNIVFDASASSDPDGQIVSYAWTFGDGGTASGLRPNHGYGLAGVYTVTLTVTDDRGVTASVAKPVTVGSAVAPKADFSFSPAAPVPNQNVNFNAAASTATAPRHIVAYDWDFGDGQTASGVTAQHSYALEGSYNVVLKVTDDAGRTGVVVKPLTVGVGGPKADFTFSPTTPGPGQTVNFNGALSTTAPGRQITSYSWDFGDGSQGSGMTPAHVFAFEGNFTIVLTVTDNTGATGVLSKVLPVKAP